MPAAMAFFTGDSQFEQPTGSIAAAVGRRHRAHHRDGARLPAADRLRAHVRRGEGLTDGPIEEDLNPWPSSCSNKLTKRFPDGTEAVHDADFTIGDGEFFILVGPVGLREVDPAQHDRGPRGHQRGRAEGRRQDRERRGPQGSEHGDGVPELRHLPAHDRAREHGVPPQAGQDAEGGDGPAGRPGGQDPGADRAARPQAGQPLRWPAPAGGHGPCHRPRTGLLPDGRAAVEPRRQAAGADAHRHRSPAAAPGHHDRLRHPRPDRGHDPRRQGRRAAQGLRPAGRQSPRAVQLPGEPVRRPASSAHPP